MFIRLLPLALALTLTACSASMPSLEDRFLFQPSTFPDGEWEHPGVNFFDVDFRSADGTPLHAWYCPVRDPRGHVLYLHGNAGNLSHRAPIVARLNDLGLSVFIVDYRGYGRSKGKPTVAGAIADARAARRMLAESARIKESDIVLMGRSLGGAIAAQLAAESPPRAIILESTFTSLRDIVRHYAGYVALIVGAEKLNSVAALGRSRVPLLMSHGTADTVIPFELGRQLFDAAACKPKTFYEIAGADHNDPSPDEYYRVMSRFIDALPPSGD